MRTAKLLFTAITLSGAFAATAQFTPGGLLSLKADFPGLIEGYNHVAVDANFAPTGTPDWELVETTDLSYDGNNTITHSIVASTYPVPIYEATGSKTGNVYTSLVKLQSGSNWNNYQRETFYSDGTNDTMETVESYDTIAATYANVDKWVTLYNTINKPVTITHYKWVAGAWSNDTRRDITYNGFQTATDTTYTVPGGDVVSKFVEYYYVSGKLDSMAWYDHSGSINTMHTVYSMGQDVDGNLNTIYGHTQSGTDWNRNTRSTFVKLTTAVNNVVSNTTLSVYPIPATNELHVTGVQAGSVLTLTALSGRIIFTTSIGNGAASVNTSTLPAGAYLLSVQQTGTPAVYRKIVITH